MKSSQRILILTLAFLPLLYSCGQKSGSKEEIEIINKELPVEKRAEKALYDEVMAVHDEAMPKMDRMMSIKGGLQEKIDLLRESESSEDTKSLEEAVSQLEEANEAMMQWMRDFEPPDDEIKTHEEILGYYKNQKQLIDDVHQQMKDAMAHGEGLNQ